MKYFKKIENELIQCKLCGHECVLGNNSVGKCRVNKNVGGKLVCLVYGKPIAVHVDPIEKKPLFHFEKGTNTYSLGTYGCNFKCQWCQNYQISQSDLADMDHIPTYSPESIVDNAISNNCTV